jgi:hypothetical protein
LSSRIIVKRTLAPSGLATSHQRAIGVLALNRESFCAAIALQSVTGHAGIQCGDVPFVVCAYYMQIA